MAQIPFGGDNETPGTFHYTIAQNKGEIDLSAQILIEVTNAESKRAGMHFGNFSGQMFRILRLLQGLLCRRSTVQ